MHCRQSVVVNYIHVEVVQVGREKTCIVQKKQVAEHISGRVQYVWLNAKSSITILSLWYHAVQLPLQAQPRPLFRRSKPKRLGQHTWAKV